MIRFTSFLFALFISCTVYAATAKSTVILLSVDGFAFNYIQEYQPKNILSFAKSGVQARLLPVYPSKTFPNHLSIITGSYPVNHGIIHNIFYHPDLGEQYYLSAGKDNKAWLTAEPFWSTAESNGIKSAVYFWPESEGKGYTQPSFNIPYNRNTPNKTIIDQLITWLKLPADQRPNFLASYFSSVDSAGHNFGLGSPQLLSAINEFDELFGYFLDRINNEVHQAVNIILVSDHGMEAITDEAKIFTPIIFKHLNEKAKGIQVTYSDTQVFVYFDKNIINKQVRLSFVQTLKENLLANKKGYTVYSNGDYPDYWHFNENLAIVPDVILEATPPARFVRNNKSRKTHGATHGYDSINNNNLHGIFIASGPNVVNNKEVDAFSNIHVFPFMNRLLGLNENIKIDGKLSKLQSIIK